MIVHAKYDILAKDLYAGHIEDADIEDPDQVVIPKGTVGAVALYHPHQAQGLTVQVEFEGATRPWLIDPLWVEEDYTEDDYRQPKLRRLLAVIRNRDTEADPNLVEIRNFDDLSGKSWMENHLSRFGVLKQNNDIEDSQERFKMAAEIAKKLGMPEMVDKVRDAYSEGDAIRFSKFSFYIYQCYDVDDVCEYIESYRRREIPYIE